jgi:site-specific DNA recombinase
MTAALIYCRVSEDRTGQERSVVEQEAECRAECDRRNWEVVEVVAENDRSASKYAKRKRPDWMRVKSVLAGGDIDVLVTWEASRAGRDLGEYVRLRDLCVAAGVKLSYSGRVLDLSTSTDSFLGGLDALLAERESAVASERIRRNTRAAAASGRPHGKRLFGYRRLYDATSGALIGQEPEPDEAVIVAEIVQRVARGSSLRGLAWELTERGEKTSTGSPWCATTVRRVARNPAYAGVRVHHGEHHPATWPPIVTRELLEAARSRTDSNNHGRRMPSSVAVHLLSGLMKCGLCGARMFRGHDRSRGVYVCTRRGALHPSSGEILPIGHLSISQASTDELVTEVVAAWLARPDVASRVTAPPGSATSSQAREVAALRGRMDEAVAAFNAGRLSISTLTTIEQELLPRIKTIETSAYRSAMAPVVADALGQEFRDLPLAHRREIISAILTITINKGRKTRQFDTSRVVFSWNG